jgi:hypothetical protein
VSGPRRRRWAINDPKHLAAAYAAGGQERADEVTALLQEIADDPLAAPNARVVGEHDGWQTIKYKATDGRLVAYFMLDRFGGDRTVRLTVLELAD